MELRDYKWSCDTCGRSGELTLDVKTAHAVINEDHNRVSPHCIGELDVEMQRL